MSNTVSGYPSSHSYFGEMYIAFFNRDTGAEKLSSAARLRVRSQISKDKVLIRLITCSRALAKHFGIDRLAEWMYPSAFHGGKCVRPVIFQPVDL